MTGPDASAAAVFGEYFQLTVRDGGGWRALDELAGPSLRDQIAPTAQAIGGADRVAASVWFLGLAARLVSPPFGHAALTGTLPLVAAHTIWSRGTGPLAAEMIDARSGDPRTLGVALHDEMIRPVLAPLVDVVADEFSLSRQVLWGNVASAVNGARTVVTAVRPDLRAAAEAMQAGALSGELLAGTWSTSETGFRRRNCCLLYRAPGGGLCADCVLRR